VTVSVWRIATDTRTYTADDLSGAGAKIAGGRWNKVGEALLYTSENRSLACLETVVHLKAAGLPFNRFLVRIDIPDDLWAAAQRETPTSLPVGWNAVPEGLASVDFGTGWIAGRTSCLLIVPSAIVPDELNILVNPLHPGATRVAAQKVRQWLYDPRLTS
jgi:RES domain-containing protein